MPKDDRNVLTKSTAKKIRDIASEHDFLDELYHDFVSKESHCAPFVLKVIKGCADNIIENTLLSSPPSPQNEEEMMEESVLNIIPKAFRVVDSYTLVSKILQNIFALGLIYGRSVYEQDLEEWIDEAFGNTPLDMDIQSLSEALKAIHNIATPEQIERLFNSIGIKPDEEEYTEDRGPSGEEDPQDS